MSKHNPFHLAGVVLLLASGGVAVGGASDAARYVGVWNYDQPNFADATNIAFLRMAPVAPQTSAESPSGKPAEIPIPQVGNIVITQAGQGRLIGTTDQGCTWSFRIAAEFAELDPASQTCFNKIIGSSYTITKWTLHIDGTQATESIVAASHLPSGDSAFVLAKGRRTRADSAGAQVRFEGRWGEDAANSQTGLNVGQMWCEGSRAPQPVMTAPFGGDLQFVNAAPGKLRVVTGDGCSLELQQQGNTAILGSPQSCRKDRALTVEHWSMANDGQHILGLLKIVANVEGKACTSVFGAETLSRR